VLAALGLEHAQTATNSGILTAGDRKLPAPRQAAEKSLGLLQRTAGSFLISGGCVSCHAQNLTGMAVSVARANGFKVDETAAADQLKSAKLQWASAEQPFLQRMDPGGAVDNLMYSACSSPPKRPRLTVPLTP
jgi:hypothetical protein